MIPFVLSLIFASSLAFLDLFASHLCMQPFIFFTLAYYTLLLYAKNPYSRLVTVFFVLMLLAHFLYGNELRLLWYLIPLTLASAYGQQLVFSKRYQPFCLLLLSTVIHRLFIDHIPLQSLLSLDYTTPFSIATLILVALFSLK